MNVSLFLFHSDKHTSPKLVCDLLLALEDHKFKSDNVLHVSIKVRISNSHYYITTCICILVNSAVEDKSVES